MRMIMLVRESDSEDSDDNDYDDDDDGERVTDGGLHTSLYGDEGHGDELREERI